MWIISGLTGQIVRDNSAVINQPSLYLKSAPLLVL